MRKTLPRLLLVLLIAAAVAGAYAAGLHRALDWRAVKAHAADWREAAWANLPLALVVFFGVYVSVTALTIPMALVLSLVAGALFDLALGVAVVSAASTAGATLAFLTSRYLLHDWVRARLGKRLEALDRGVERDGIWYLLWMRLTPVIPFFLINVGMGLTRMPLGRYALVTWLGMLPVTAVLVQAGTLIHRIERPSDALSPTVVGTLALIGLMPLLLRWAGRLLLPRRPPQGVS